MLLFTVVSTRSLVGVVVHVVYSRLFSHSFIVLRVGSTGQLIKSEKLNHEIEMNS